MNAGPNAAAQRRTADRPEIRRGVSLALLLVALAATPLATPAAAETAKPAAGAEPVSAVEYEDALEEAVLEAEAAAWPDSAPTRCVPSPIADTRLRLTGAQDALDVTAEDIAHAAVEHDAGGKPVVRVSFCPMAAALLYEFTAAHVGAQIDFEVDGRVLTSAFVTAPIAGGDVAIGGALSLDQAKAIAATLVRGD